MNKNTLKIKTLIASVALSILIVSQTTPVAKAGFIDWIGGTEANEVSVKSSFHFGLAYLKQDTDENTSKDEVSKSDTPAVEVAPTIKKTVSSKIQPVSPDATIIRTYKVTVTAYTSEGAQTDDSPCIPASGVNLCDRNTEDVIAANFLPLYTRVIIDGLNNDKPIYVLDRMNKRYTPGPDNPEYRVDRWMKDKSEALKFGKRTYTMHVLASEKAVIAK